MSFYAQASDLATTRATAQRALRTINYREQDEKHNVWLALLNLENLAGSEDSLDEAFREAVQANDPKSIHLHMLQLLERSKKYEVGSSCPLHRLMVHDLGRAESRGAVAGYSEKVQPRSSSLAALCPILLPPWSKRGSSRTPYPFSQKSVEKATCV